MVTVWIDKIKRILKGFLATEDSKYLTTEDDFLIQILDLGEFSENAKSSNSWSESSKSVNSWNDKTKS